MDEIKPMNKIELVYAVVENVKHLTASVDALVAELQKEENSITATKATNEIKNKEKDKTPAALASLPEENNITLVELRALCANKSRENKRSEIKDILTRYNVEKLSDLDIKYYPTLKAEVEAL